MDNKNGRHWRPFLFSFSGCLVAHILIGDAGATEQFKFLTVGKWRAYAVVVEGRRTVSGAEVEPGEAVAIAVEHVH
jgi:hypothetical protein